MTIDADRLNEIRERWAGVENRPDAGADVRFLLAALDAAEQQAADMEKAAGGMSVNVTDLGEQLEEAERRAVQAEQERDEARIRSAELFREHELAERRAEAAEARATKATNALTNGIEAFRLTREYVGEDVLPAVEGWSWFDWCQEARRCLAELAAEDKP